eukprot:6212848-Pleurochrysis_carterae.AAC.1
MKPGCPEADTGEDLRAAKQVSVGTSVSRTIKEAISNNESAARPLLWKRALYKLTLNANKGGLIHGIAGQGGLSLVATLIDGSYWR